MGTLLWGPDMWYVIHVIADSAPDVLTDTEITQYSNFYKSIGHVLPCPSCGVHYNEFLKKDPPTFKTRVEMLQWTIRAHNNANQLTGKPVLDEDTAFLRIAQEISARESGLVRGRIPTIWERCLDSALPASVIVCILLILLYTTSFNR